MAYTLLSYVDQNVGSGGPHSPYFYPEDIARIFRRSSTIVATKIMKAVFPSGSTGVQIFIMVGIIDFGPPNEPENATLYTGQNAIAVLPCPPYNEKPPTFYDADGNESSDPFPDS